MTRPQALLLDLDGTLYDLRALRRRVIGEFAFAVMRSPRRALRDARIIHAYRRAQELIRQSPGEGVPASRQSAIAARECGYPLEAVEESVARCFDEGPLRHLRSCAFEGLMELLEYCRNAGIRLAICSDYPAARKLEAMQVAQYFDVVTCAQDSEVDRFKPSPRILEVALARLGVDAADALYAGDRPEVDGAAAAAAGIPYLNIVQRPGKAGVTLLQLLARLRG